MKPEFHESKHCKAPYGPDNAYSSDLCIIVDAQKMVPVFYHSDAGGEMVESYTDPQANAPAVIYEKEVALALIAKVQTKYTRQNIAPELRRHYGIMNVYAVNIPETKASSDAELRKAITRLRKQLKTGTAWRMTYIQQ